jgi:hypothetical protein
MLLNNTISFYWFRNGAVCLDIVIINRDCYVICPNVRMLMCVYISH